jgi:2-iminobutanoate/2-iminopropanoate deaminase
VNYQIIRTEQAPAPVGPYNQAIAATGKLLFLSGQVALNPQGTIVGPGDVVQQTEQVIANIKAVLQAAGATLQNVVKTTVFLTDMNDFATVNNIYAQHFGDESAPARSCVEVSRLPKDVQVEIECIAVLP